MITAIIVEDEKSSRDLLAAMIKQYAPNVEVIAQSGEVDESITLIKHLKPQLVFMDIQLPGRNAFQLLDVFPDRSFEVIFTTAYEQYALQAIKYSGIDYLLKPIGLNELKDAIKKAEEKIYRPAGEEEKKSNAHEPEHSERLVVPTQQGFMMLESGQVMYLEAEGAYTRIYMQDGESILVSNPIGVYENRLPFPAFVRIHRSRLVNLWYIQEYIRGRGGYILLKNGLHLNVSARKKASLLEALGL